MQIWLGVENFAKIESAKVNISSYTLLVGQNNSGKTFLMQLAQGVREKLADLMKEDLLQVMHNDGSEQVKDYLLTDDNFGRLTNYLNKRLYDEKENIVKEIFGKEIPVEKLYIELLMESEDANEIFIWSGEQPLKEPISGLKRISMGDINHFVEKYANKRRVCLMVRNKNGKREFISLTALYEDSEISIFGMALRNILKVNSLYLPASRAGLMLLYREFFANVADDAIMYKLENGSMVEETKYRGLTKPMYEFLRFLQNYRESGNIKEQYRDALAFFEKKLIGGKIRVNQNGGFSYSIGSEAEDISMHLASSMINEIAPMELALKGSKVFECLIIDEVEASLHPEKQMELVRFLNRLNNGGMELILSTHSDTFVSKVNNLYILSQMVNEKDQTDIMEKLGLEKGDLIDPKKLHVYEFVSQKNGKSVVKEIIGDSQTGFQFDLFTESAMQLYEEALKLGEVQKNDQTEL